jgi:hypothetical protein
LQAKSEEQLESEKAFLEAERVWLVHKDGFVAAGLLKRSDSTQEGKVRVQLDYNGDIIEVGKLPWRGSSTAAVYCTLSEKNCRQIHTLPCTSQMS